MLSAPSDKQLSALRSRQRAQKLSQEQAHRPRSPRSKHQYLLPPRIKHRLRGLPGVGATLKKDFEVSQKSAQRLETLDRRHKAACFPGPGTSTRVLLTCEPSGYPHGWKHYVSSWMELLHRVKRPQDSSCLSTLRSTGNQEQHLCCRKVVPVEEEVLLSLSPTASHK